ncbi:MAG: alanine racemase [Candidatus Thioglobus sp.]|nr:alanine racemase [Candidatus Thioglobus sp.]
MRAQASISQSALAHNLSIVKHYAPQAKIVAMVKANAYGHRLNHISPLLENADLLGVSELSEAQELRQKTNKPILLLSGIFSNAEMQQAAALNCHIVVHNPNQIALISQAKQAQNVWIKINTGMNRLGLSAENYHKCLEQFQANPLVKITAIMSHFACADEPNHPLNAKQLDDFTTLTDGKNKRSMANSAAILSKLATFDFVRPGIMLYGVSPFSNNTYQLKPAMQLSAKILAIQTLEKGQSVGYGGTWTANQKTTIATIGIGYADGYPRGAQRGTPVLINNALCPLVGRVSMDLITVDISKITAKIGDKVILWGDEKISVNTVAKFSNTISYELLAAVSSRVSFKSCP